MMASSSVGSQRLSVKQEVVGSSPTWPAIKAYLKAY